MPQARRASLPRVASLLLCGVVIGLHWQRASGLWTLWMEPGRKTYVHGFLIAGLKLWLLVSQRRKLAERRAFPDPRGSAPLLFLTLAWRVGLRSGIQAAYEADLPLLLWLATMALFGATVARVCAFPMAFLYFALPADGALGSLRGSRGRPVRAGSGWQPQFPRADA